MVVLDAFPEAILGVEVLRSVVNALFIVPCLVATVVPDEAGEAVPDVVQHLELLEPLVQIDDADDSVHSFGAFFEPASAFPVISHTIELDGVIDGDWLCAV